MDPRPMNKSQINKPRRKHGRKSTGPESVSTSRSGNKVGRM